MRVIERYSQYMRNDNLVQETRTDKNGVSRKMWVKPQQAAASKVLSAAPPSVSPAQLSMTQKKSQAYTALFERVDIMCGQVSIRGERYDQILEKMSNLLESASEPQMDLIHEKLVTGSNTNALVRAVSQMFITEKTPASQQTIMEFMALDEYHGYRPSKDYVERCQLFVMGLHDYTNNREPVDIEDHDSIRRNGALLRFTMDAVDASSGLDIDIVKSGKAGYSIPGDELADIVLNDPERFLGDASDTHEFISLIHERGVKAATEIFLHPDYRKGSALRDGML